MTAEQEIEIIHDQIKARSSHWSKIRSVPTDDEETQYLKMLELSRNQAEMEEFLVKLSSAELNKEQKISEIYRKLLNKSMNSFSELRRLEREFLEEHGELLFQAKRIPEKNLIEINKLAMSLLTEYATNLRVAQDPLVAEPRKRIVFMKKVSATIHEEEKERYCLRVDNLSKKDVEYISFIEKYLFENDYIAEDNHSLAIQFAFNFLLDNIRYAFGGAHDGE